MRTVGSTFIKESLIHVLKQPPTFGLFQTLAVEVQEVLLDILLKTSSKARLEFENHFGPLGETF